MSTTKKTKREQILFLCQFSILLAIEIIVCFTPLGTLPSLGMLSATLSHVPVIITAVILGMKAGALMGFAFGACSFIYWTFVAPGAFSFIYTPFYTLGEYQGNFGSLLICFVPRILIGVVTVLVMKGLMKLIKNEFAAAAIAGVCGTLTNTLLVLLGIYVFFGNEYYALASDGSRTLLAFLGVVVLTNGLPEAVIGGVAASAIAVPVKRAVGKRYLKVPAKPQEQKDTENQ
ncbi:MAG: ECF transporter S component [Clostridiales bacterium]|nr:ECF transporter S component [Clostridiales bacterium]MCD7827700.1 ECF transporter S component [Clostridiales bacterium]